MMQIRKAERKQAKLRIGMFGPSGAGKTMSALKLARGMADWDKIVIIDTENHSADLYSNLGPYNVLSLDPNYTPERYIEAINAAEQAGMEVIIIDSITHEWAGKGGILELADQLGKDAKNNFMVWAKLTPRHNAFIERILQSTAHVICCGRSKQDYALNQTEKNGRTVSIPEKIGLKSITREGFDYEMTVSFDLTITHYAVSTKDRTGLFQDKPEEVITEAAGKKLVEWNNGGAVDVEAIHNAQRKEIMVELKRLGVDTTNGAAIKTWVKTMTKLDLEAANFAAIIVALQELKPEPQPIEPPFTEEPKPVEVTDAV